MFAGNADVHPQKQKRGHGRETEQGGAVLVSIEK